MPDKGTQIRNKMISKHPNTDRAKLAGLETFIHKQYPEMHVVLEPWLHFTKGEDQFIGWSHEVYAADKHMKLVHTDMMVFYGLDSFIVFELDGAIHDIKTEKTSVRNMRYELNKMTYIVINETDLKYKLAPDKDPKNWKLSQDEINTEFKERMEELL